MRLLSSFKALIDIEFICFIFEKRKKIRLKTQLFKLQIIITFLWHDLC